MVPKSRDNLEKRVSRSVGQPGHFDVGAAAQVKTCGSFPNLVSSTGLPYNHFFNAEISGRQHSRFERFDFSSSSTF